MSSTFRVFVCSGNHDVVIFDTLPEGEFKDETSPLPPIVRLPGAKSLYLGTIALQVTLGLCCIIVFSRDEAQAVIHDDYRVGLCFVLFFCRCRLLEKLT